MQLNPQQERVLTQSGSHQLIVAGPGTGKTHTLTQKILSLLQSGSLPQEVVAITFTTKAAEEMKDRIQSQTDKNPFIGTFHALAHKILKAAGADFNLLQPKQQDAILSELTPKLKQKEKKEFKRLLTLAKNQILPFEEVNTFIDQDRVQNLYNQYAERLESENLIDFDDLLLKGLEHLKESGAHPKHLFIDEYQDINEVQYRMIRTLAGPETHIYAIGDPDQSIYAFRGSNLEHFLRFEKDFPSAVRTNLEQNYRSTPQIIAAANALIKNNDKRIEKEIIATKQESSTITLHPFQTEWQEGGFITREISQLVGGTDMIQSHNLVTAQKEYHFSDIAILYRTKSQARVITESLKKEGIPFQCISTIPWYLKPEVQELLQYLQYLHSPTASTDIPETQKILLNSYVRDHRDLSSINPSTLIKKIIQYTKLEESHDDGSPRAHQKIQNLKKLQAEAAMFDDQAGEDGLSELLDHYSLLQDYDHYNPKAKAVSLMTLHAAKGLEFPVVFIAGLEDGLLPFSREGETQNEEEERRLFYVGITRAQEKLYLSYAKTRNKTETKPSPFLAEIKKHVSEQELPKQRQQKPDNQMTLF
ncbi:MAG: 3'-5' exonuclease [Candidatus Gracilibacteria bacterium]